MKKIFVTQQGLRALEARRLEFMEKLRTIQKQKGPAAEEGTWHDNFSFEQLVNEERAVTKQLQDLRDVIDRARVVGPTPSSIRTLQVGHIAKLYLEDDDVYREFQIGGFGESDLTANPPIVEYCAPILEPFFGHEEGHEAVVELGGVEKSIVLTSITLKGS